MARRQNMKSRPINEDWETAMDLKSLVPFRPRSTLTPADVYPFDALGRVDTYRNHKMIAARVTTAR